MFFSFFTPCPPIRRKHNVEVERQSKEIYDLMNWAQEGVDQGTRYPGMSYEQGILDALMWLDGSSDHNPMDG